jgi:hypothetical protein
MGLQAKCSASFEGKVSSGNALLESEQLIFRGDYRVVVPFKAIKRLSEAAGKLSIECTQGMLILDLGNEARKWEDKIKNPKTLVDKLGVKRGMRVTVHKVDDSGFLKALKEKGIEYQTKASKMSDMIFFQSDSIKELSSVGALAESLAKNGTLWLVYPKGKKEIKQEDVFKTGKLAGLVDVKVVSFSSTHTALKFVIPVSKR